MIDGSLKIRAAGSADLEFIEKLLVDSDLMAVEVAANLEWFLVAEQAGVIGVIGSEYAGESVLIRSLAVKSAIRQNGVASALLKQALAQAKSAGCKFAYLFTNTAAEYFAKRGFAVVPRSEVPAALLASPAVTVCCCSTAVAMRLALSDPGKALPAAITAEFQVTGISCMDCAQKFEQAVRQLPGVQQAALNPMSGRLTVTGAADLPAIRELGLQEGYAITPTAEVVKPVAGARPAGWELWRAIASGVALASGFGLEKLAGPQALYMVLYVAAILLGGWGNFHKAARALPRGNFNMSVLMSAAVLGAMAIGQYEEGASVAFLYAVSEMLEAWTIDKARCSIQRLMELTPDLARIRRDGVEMKLHITEVRPGDVMILRPGDQIAMDGIVRSGKSSVNQAAITGESLPALKEAGAEVFAGTLNGPGALEVTVTKLAQDSTLARIIQLVENAQTQRAPSQAFVEKFAAVYTPVVLALAAAVAVLPPLFWGYQWASWIYRGLALLVVACPCALVVSTPVAIVSAISSAARQGVLIKGGIYLEAAGSLQAIAFDKTGTLTRGEPVVTDVVAVGDWQEAELLGRAADLEARSEHPLAAAIVQAAKQQGLAVTPVEDFIAITGRGGQGTVAAELLYVGNSRLFTELGADLSFVAEPIERLQQQGKTVMIVGTSEEIQGIIAVADTVRPDSAATMKALKNAGIQHTIMLTGDNSQAARTIAAQVGVDEYRAELLPEDKVTAMQELLAKYGQVAMVGDGINDAPALALSTVGIAMGGAAADTAMETADIVLMANDLKNLPFTIQLSRQALQIIRQNISFSIGIKLLAVLAVFPGWLTLWLAILADMGATLLVTLNSLRLLQRQRKTGDN